MATAVEEISANRHYNGYNRRYKHRSTVLGCDMTFTVYFPPAAETGKVPVLYYLSGLTCNDENFIQKSGAQRAAATRGIALVAPDTSPRGLGVEGEADSWDFGVGAGFYLNSTQEKWRAWRMYDYVVEELPSLLRSTAPFATSLDVDQASVFGHSMGGHGALVVGLRNPQTYRSISAFAPVCHPINCPWGVKAFTGYLGEDRELWKQYDACELLRSFSGPVRPPILVDTGSADKFLQVQLQPQALEAAIQETGYSPATMRTQEGYDHSYFFISTFVDDHINFHADVLLPGK
ncbi:hypothetical protein VOLCADRAFT_99938 [Volvox carteri f. nagariensis]|uniref:S-formylglutathione hydrolase n=1 Tax=Volvox carteri f. nagariensis TaxID=3068 RepID=D8UJ11_VOLCA|nr:uncharacterized protein VOLCADRAFT_99938 [Volvox carteri f. nagariensis]EFJ40293.1 hypothetical protein VOLCADRAFT_99938 [Volvox carteri f. nagariensis]|eukprot:XP_002958627.1 hypothetical protein VOLCADRAFT_99938 [Volvox carteri f. nagariensis]